MQSKQSFTLSALLAVALAGCPNNQSIDGGHDSGIVSLAPADYRTNGFTVVRDCRATTEHTNPAGTEHSLDAHGIIVYINSAAAADYDAHSNALADGTMVIKEEHDDETCSHLLGWSIMHKEPGFDPNHHNWHWQHVLADGTVDRDGIVPGCLDGACHTGSTCINRDLMCTQP